MPGNPNQAAEPEAPSARAGRFTSGDKGGHVPGADLGCPGGVVDRPSDYGVMVAETGRTKRWASPVHNGVLCTVNAATHELPVSSFRSSFLESH